MNNRMTVWTQNHKVIQRVIFSIFIQMMNSKNFRMCIISTFLTFFYFTSNFKSFSNTTIRRFPRFDISFLDTCTRAIFSVFKSLCIFKFFTTMQTIKFWSRFYFCNAVTFYRTIFRFIYSTFNDRICVSAYFAIFFKIFRLSQIMTFSGTKFSFINSMQSNVKFFFTFLTFNNFSITRFKHANP